MAGDVADAMLDGTLCEGCGEFIGSPVGYPVRCAGCKQDDPVDADQSAYEWVRSRSQAVPDPKLIPVDQNSRATVSCHSCQKKVKEVGLGRHVKDAHPESQQVMKYNHSSRGNTPGGKKP